MIRRKASQKKMSRSINLCRQTLYVPKSWLLLSEIYLFPLPTKNSHNINFYTKDCIGKQCAEKEKMLVINIFSLSIQPFLFYLMTSS